jgi:hypothetical protein
VPTPDTRQQGSGTRFGSAAEAAIFTVVMGDFGCFLNERFGHGLDLRFS